MSEEIQAAIVKIESEMAELSATINSVNRSIDPIRIELDILNDRAIAAQTLANQKAAELEAARPANWLEIKRKFGELASARMQLRQLLK
jgi:chromosome segregation ATPase